MKWTFKNEKDIEEEVALEKWAWHVYYTDKTELYQFDTDFKFHQFKEIDQTKLDYFEMISTDNPNLRHSIDCKDVDQIFHFYRNVRLDIGGSNETKLRFYCFGYVKNGVSTYHFILPNNRIVITHNRDIQLI